jgi:formylmethanofuran dehydrogenase subunit C
VKTITLSLRADCEKTIDLASLRLDELIKNTADQIARQHIHVSSTNEQLGDVFHVECQADDHPEPRLVLRGDCRSVHGLGHQHRIGTIIVEGNIGDHCGACMSGGTIRVQGSAGNHLAAPTGSRGIGMNGGQIIVEQNVGEHAGQRMRRGEIWITGDAGAGLASWQVAGTIGVGGQVSEKHVGYGMRRGTLLLATPIKLPTIRFSTSVVLDTSFCALLLRRTETQQAWPPAKTQQQSSQWLVSRGDLSIGGIGEVWQRLP